MKSSDKSPPVAVTMGEPSGIGGEIAIRAWQQTHSEDITPFFLIDDPKRLRYVMRQLDISVPVGIIGTVHDAGECFSKALPVLPILDLVEEPCLGKPNVKNGQAVLHSIEHAVKIALTGDVAGIVTNPIQKSILKEIGFNHLGHTEYLSTLTKSSKSPVMMLVSPCLRVVPVTVHMSLAQALERLTTKKIVDSTITALSSLTTDFGVECPRGSIAALNPHGGENGQMGMEEIDIIRPALNILRSKAYHVSGPHPADTMFHPSALKTFDVAICMYHDQALIPLKTIDFHHGVNVTLGLPIIRASPDHGTALDIAGLGIANPTSFIASIRLVSRMARQRRITGN